jgi:predicted DNA-binding transcriptional regulator YafY
MRNDRLLSILLLLQAHGRLSARELAARLETSIRTIYRDVDALSAAGVPVFTETGRRGGVVLLPGYRTDLTGLTPAEAEAIFVAAGRGVLADLGLDEQLQLALRKLMAALPAEQRSDTQRARDRVIVESGRWLGEREPTPFLESVRRAVLGGRRLAISYRSGSDGTARASSLDPYGLVSKGGTWYLIAASADHPDRPAWLYRVSRIEAASQLDDPARLPPNLDVGAEWERLRRGIEERGSGVPVRFAVRRERREMLLRMARPQVVGPPRVEDLDAEWSVVEAPFVALGAAEGLLLGFGTDVEVLAPPELRDSMARTAAEVVALYSPRASGSSLAGPSREPSSVTGS